MKKKCYALKTDPILLEILFDGLTSWLHSTPVPTTVFPPEYHRLLQEQTAIGWGQFFQGRVSTQWSIIQQWHYSGYPKVKGRDGQSWSRTILRHIFTHWNSLWDSRNAARHGRDSTTHAIAAKDQAIRELELLYSLRTTVLQRDTDLFYNSLEDHKNKPTRTIRQWINTYQPLILKSAKDAKTKSLLHVRPITSYFGKG